MTMRPRERPFFVEFTGTPESGKTTTVHRLFDYLDRSNVHVGYIREAAETLPKELPKPSWDATLYLRASAIASIILSAYQGYEIVLVDRGLVDGQFWGFRDLNAGLCSIEEFSSYMALHSNLNLGPDLLIAMVSDPEVSIERRGGEGRLVTHKFLEEYNEVFRNFYKSISYPKVLIDSTHMSKDEVVSSVKEALRKYWQRRTRDL